MKTTRTNKLENYLISGKRITAYQIYSNFNLDDPYSAIRRLREKGLCIYTNKTKNRNTTYRLGRPTNKLIALGYLAARSLSGNVNSVVK